MPPMPSQGSTNPGPKPVPETGPDPEGKADPAAGWENLGKTGDTLGAIPEPRLGDRPGDVSGTAGQFQELGGAEGKRLSVSPNGVGSQDAVAAQPVPCPDPDPDPDLDLDLDLDPSPNSGPAGESVIWGERLARWSWKPMWPRPGPGPGKGEGMVYRSGGKWERGFVALPSVS